MSSHSEEMWDSFDALWQQLSTLSRRVRELEARLGALEQIGLEQVGAGAFEEGFKFPAADPEQGSNSNSVYKGEIHK